MYDLSTQAGVLRFCESKRSEMARCFERVGRFEENGHSFCGYLFATHAMEAPRNPKRLEDWRTGARLPRPEAVLCRMPSNALLDAIHPNMQKDIFAHVLRSQGKLQKALGYLLMTEMWMVTAEGGTPEEAYRARAAMPDSLEFAPGRKEGLMLAIEHGATGYRMWFAGILREPTRLLEWEERELSGAEGRLVDLTDWRS